MSACHKFILTHRALLFFSNKNSWSAVEPLGNANNRNCSACARKKNSCSKKSATASAKKS